MPVTKIAPLDLPTNAFPRQPVVINPPTADTTRNPCTELHSGKRMGEIDPSLPFTLRIAIMNE